MTDSIRWINICVYLQAFGLAKYGRAQKSVQRNLDMHHRKERAPVADRAPDVLPPVVVVVMGPPGSGKTTLIKSLVKRYTKHSLSDIKGPITVVTGKQRRVTFFECPSNDLNAMIDLSKIADLVLLTVDASFGFEMETFEFLNLLQTHGFPRVMGILTHLDKVRDGKRLRRIKKTLKQRFWVEIHQGAKLFYLSGCIHGQYMKNEIHNLSLYISRIRFRPLQWRSAHPYCLVDRWEDVTDPALVQDDASCDRKVAVFGFLRGAHLKPGMRVHMAGAGDFALGEVTPLPDPIPLPETDPEKRKAKRTLNARETILYAPMSNVGAVLYDKDAVYINLPQVHFTRQEHLLPGDRKDGEPEVVEMKGYGAADGFDNDDGDDDESDSDGGAGGQDSDGDEVDAATAQRRAKGTKQSLLKSADGMALMRGLQGIKKGMEDRLGGVGLQLFRGGAVVKDRDARAMMDAGDDSEDDGDGSSDGEMDEDDDGELFDDDEEEEDDEDEDMDGSDDDEDGDDDAPAGGRARPAFKMPSEKLETDTSGRTRRRAVFDGEESDDEDDDSDTDDDDGAAVEDGARWKRGLTSRAEAALQERRRAAPNIMELVYGNNAASSKNGDDDGNASDDSDGSELFRVRKAGTSTFQAKGANAMPLGGSNAGKAAASKASIAAPPVLDLLGDINAEDCSAATVYAAASRSTSAAASSASSSAAAVAASRWRDTSLQRAARNRFVTGDWGGKKKSAIGAGGDDADDNDGSGSEDLDADDDDDDDGSEMYGDFEDLEGGGDGGSSKAGSSKRRSSKSNDSVDSGDDDDDDEDEDMEGSDEHGSDSDGADDASRSETGDATSNPRSMTTATRNIAAERARAAAEKAAMKASFDAEYDKKKGKGDVAGENENGAMDGDDEGGDPRLAGLSAGDPRRVAAELLEETEEQKAAKHRAVVQSEINKAEFASLPDAVRMRMTGFPAGCYVRIELEGVPAEFVTRFRPQVPVLLGGLLAQEEGLTLLRMRIKKHRWYPRILKTNDPLVFSIGWRRFQSLPLLSVQDDNERHRYLKYTPEHMHCFATAYGPVTPPNTGLVAFQSLASNTSAFRVAATGVVLELDASLKVMKKLKLTGVPHKIFKNTAFVRGMFNSELEVAKFEGASIRTVSGIRGTIKKAVRDGPPGTFRATFEDKILASDIVFCRTWVPVTPHKLYNPVTSLLDAPVPSASSSSTAAASKDRHAVPEGEEKGFGDAQSDEEGGDDDGEDGDADASLGRKVASKSKPAASASGPAAAGASSDAVLAGKDAGGMLLMRTHRELRRDTGASVPTKKDSLYTDIDRPEVRKFNPLHIPRGLSAALPFESKPKQQKAKGKDRDYFNKRAVVMDKEEKKQYALMQRVFTVAREKEAKAKEAKARQKTAYDARKTAETAIRDEKAKVVKKKRYREEGITELRKNRKREEH